MSSPESNLEQTFEALVKTHRAAFERLARRLSGDPEDAQDLLQETLIDAYRAFGRFRAGTHFYSWVARIMTNNHLDRHRRKRHPVVSLEGAAREAGLETLDVPDPSANPEHAVLTGELDLPFQTALEALQPLQRAAVLLCDVQGVTYEEAAVAEACPVGTIRSRLHRAHNYLRGFLSGIAGGGDSEPAESTPAHSRRAFLRFSTAAAAGAALTQLHPESADAARPLGVLIWTGGTQSSTLGRALARSLHGDTRVEVHTASDPEQGLTDRALRGTDVLIWCGDEAASPERRAAVARRVRDGGMGLIVAGAAAGEGILHTLLGPEFSWTGAPQAEATPLDLRVTAPRHPIGSGLSAFRIERPAPSEGTAVTPRPDVVVFDGTYGEAAGSAWQGMVWKLDRGRVFYFRFPHPKGTPTLQDEVRRIVRNAVHWCAAQ